MASGVIDFSRVRSILFNIEQLTDDRLWLFSAGQRSIREEIIRLNTEDQLYDKGIDSLGKSLGPYQPFTIEIKKEKGQRFDHITLKDTGAFYESGRCFVDLNGWLIEFDDEKGNKALFEVYGIDVAGLTNENKQKIKEMLIPIMVDYAIEQILR